MKKAEKEAEHKAKTWEENMNWLDASVTLACNNFTKESITNEIFAEDKLFQLGEIPENLHKKVAELESHVTPSTPPKVQEERRNASTYVANRIE